MRLLHRAALLGALLMAACAPAGAVEFTVPDDGDAGLARDAVTADRAAPMDLARPAPDDVVHAPEDRATPPADAPVADLGPSPDVPAGALTPGQRVVRVGDRQVLLYVPTRWRAGAPGLVALHGNGDTAANFLATSGLQGVADAEGVALALPLALAGSGPMGVDWDAYTRPASANRDLRLVADARALLVAGGVDSRRVFLAGQSQGGYLAFHAGMVFAADFGAVNVSAAGDPMPGLGLAGMAPRRIPVDLLTGDGDFALANIRRTRDDLRARGFDLRYTELPGVGHCCPLSVRTGQSPGVWAWLSARPLP